MWYFGAVKLPTPPSTNTAIADPTEQVFKNWFQVWILLKIVARWYTICGIWVRWKLPPHPPPSTKTAIADATGQVFKNWFQIWILLKIAVKMMCRMSQFGKVILTPPPSTKTSVADATGQVFKNWFQIWILLKIALQMICRTSHFGEVEITPPEQQNWNSKCHRAGIQKLISDLNSPQNCGPDDI